jgi:anti-anti-sigma factor
MTTPLSIDATETPAGGAGLRVVGEIDLSNVDAFVAALDDLAAAHQGTLALDFRAVNYLDSAAINALFGKSDRITITANPVLMAALTVSGLADLVAVDSD